LEDAKLVAEGEHLGQKLEVGAAMGEECVQEKATA
jgi:hypothetical protein